MKIVYEFIDALLTEESKSNYVLLTAPPRRVYKRDTETLLDSGLVPYALLIFESKTGVAPVIKKELLMKYIITI